MMKITNYLVLSLFLLAFTTTFASSASFMASAVHYADDHLPEPVLDANGQKLRAGGLYFVDVYVLMEQNASALHDIPTLAFSTNKACPNEVVLSTETKFPVRISPVKSEDAVIREDTHLTIKFDMRYLCRMLISLVWGVRERESKSLLTARGNTEVDRFFIKKYKDGKYTYLLSYCKRPFGSIECRRLGRFFKNGINYVSIDGPSIPVKFRPAPEPRDETLGMIREVVMD